MAKLYEIEIDKFQASIYISAIRSKRDIILIWMETIKFFLIHQQPIAEKVSAKLTIEVCETSRLYCQLESGRKIFSIAFPFSLSKEIDELLFFSREGVNIDSKISSEIISLINHSGVFEKQDFSSFIDPIFEYSEYSPEIWSLMRELMLAEDAYIRYDWDEKRQDGHNHPLHHLDICYSNAGTFKVGLPYQISREMLAEMLDKKTQCHYLRPAT
ncbi:hypothetical protein [Delftia tsuruhatensis]|uniref:Uncharacterized protein n=1 Tax=Delftia tsuruhatensis TaxID=180282 RepID=A0AAX3SGZ8_9BURK|nr:hypothetical protein [Delftia tsuruhatensis]WFF79307.1 hypothetical protein PYR84_20475 [Delftia tsuruhatensis]